jgi:hypothetical protein
MPYAELVSDGGQWTVSKITVEFINNAKIQQASKQASRREITMEKFVQKYFGDIVFVYNCVYPGKQARFSKPGPRNSWR